MFFVSSDSVNTALHDDLYDCDRNGVKMVLGAGAVYVTVNEGIWSTSESGLNAAQRLRTYVLPETTQYWDKVITDCVSVICQQ